LILLSLFSLFIYYIFNLLKNKKIELSEEKISIKKLSQRKIFIYIFLGLISLFLGGKWTVEGAVAFAKLIGMSEYFISLVLIALGTSLPELVTSIVAATKKNVDLAVGNAVGSIIFNIFWVLGLSSFINPISVPMFAFIDVAVLLLATLLIFLFMFTAGRHKLDRAEGCLLILSYCIYMLYLVQR